MNKYIVKATCQVLGFVATVAAGTAVAVATVQALEFTSAQVIATVFMVFLARFGYMLVRAQAQVAASTDQLNKKS